MASLNVYINDFVALKELENNLLDQLRFAYEKENTINDDLLESLHFIYKNPLLEALNQIDKHEQKLASDARIATSAYDLVTVIRCETAATRVVYQVKGSLNDVNYYIVENLNFCACPSFKYNVLNKNEYNYCKHMILVKLLKAMNKLAVKYVKDTELADLIKQI